MTARSTTLPFTINASMKYQVAEVLFLCVKPRYRNVSNVLVFYESTTILRQKQYDDDTTIYWIPVCQTYDSLVYRVHLRELNEMCYFYVEVCRSTSELSIQTCAVVFILQKLSSFSVAVSSFSFSLNCTCPPVVRSLQNNLNITDWY